MPDLSLLIDQKTGEEYKNVPVNTAAKFLGLGREALVKGIKDGNLPIGSAIRCEGGKWMYSIPCERLKNYANGIDVLMLSELIERLTSKIQ